MPPLSGWENFYVIIGSSAAALTGLQFVVIALSADMRTNDADAEAALEAFGTPTIVHFCSVLLISALISTPAHTAFSLSLCLTAAGFFGVMYSLIVLTKARRQRGYAPVMSDWIWHICLPFLAYLVLLVAGIEIRAHAAGSLYVVGAAALLLLYIGIHNAWDSAVYLSVNRRR